MIFAYINRYVSEIRTFSSFDLVFFPVSNAITAELRGDIPICSHLDPESAGLSQTYSLRLESLNEFRKISWTFVHVLCMLKYPSCQQPTA